MGREVLGRAGCAGTLVRVRQRSHVTAIDDSREGSFWGACEAADACTRARTCSLM